MALAGPCGGSGGPGSAPVPLDHPPHGHWGLGPRTCMGTAWPLGLLVRMTSVCVRRGWHTVCPLEGRQVSDRRETASEVQGLAPPVSHGGGDGAGAWTERWPPRAGRDPPAEPQSPLVTGRLTPPPGMGDLSQGPRRRPRGQRGQEPGFLPLAELSGPSRAGKRGPASAPGGLKRPLSRCCPEEPRAQGGAVPGLSSRPAVSESETGAAVTSLTLWDDPGTPQGLGRSSARLQQCTGSQ